MIFVTEAATSKELGTVTLLPYQEIAIESLSNGSELVAGVGSGKSITALAYFILKECVDKVRPLYIITTARKRDTNEWTLECVNVGLAPKGPNRYGIPSVTIDSWNNIKKYANVKDAFFIFDEHKAIGSGVWAKMFIKIARANHWILLTATPGDTWMDYIPVFLANGFYKNRTEFLREHVVFSRYTSYPKVERYLNVKKLAWLKEMITVRMIGRVPKTMSHKHIITDYNKEDYAFVEKNRWNIFEETPIQNASAYARVLRKIVNVDASKIGKVMALIQEHHRVLIFYNFDYELELLRQTLSSREVPFAEWNGHKHEDIPETMDWAYLVQYTAGAEGWECTKTNVVIFFSLSYSYKTMVQAAGRIDRLNSPFEKLYYYYLHTEANIDKHILKAIEMKQNFNENDFFKSQYFPAI